MESTYYREMIENLEKEAEKEALSGKKIFIFGHCEASLTLADELISRGFMPEGIIDNNPAKHGMAYRAIPIGAPAIVMNEAPQNAIVLIVTRFYESMKVQLRNLGFTGEILRLVNYNTYADYSLSEAAMQGKRRRCAEGGKILMDLETGHPDAFFIFCPFAALGDVYYCMSYLPHYIRKRALDNPIVVCVASRACAEVAALFGAQTAVLAQRELDAAIQAVICLQYGNAFIAHQDRPYVINLHKALYMKKLVLEEIYRTGVYGLPPYTRPVIPTNWKEYSEKGRMTQGSSVILSPYAKSVIMLPDTVWKDIVLCLKKQGYQIFTNVAGNEKPIPGTTPISPRLSELKSAAEFAGMFIGIRSGLCDVVQTARCRKVALIPDYYYCDTEWKAADLYPLKDFENIEVKEEFKWTDYDAAAQRQSDEL